MEAQLARGAAAAGRSERAVLEEPAVEELLDALGDDGASEAGPAGELGSGAGVAAPHQVKHGHQRVELIARRGRTQLCRHRTPPARSPFRS